MQDGEGASEKASASASERQASLKHLMELNEHAEIAAEFFTACSRYFPPDRPLPFKLMGLLANDKLTTEQIAGEPTEKPAKRFRACEPAIEKLTTEQIAGEFQTLQPAEDTDAVDFDEVQEVD